MAGDGLPAPMNAAEDTDLPVKEMAVPGTKKAPADKKTEKKPAPQAKPELPQQEEPEASPEDTGDDADCDDCVIVRSLPGSGEPWAASPVPASETVPGTDPASGSGPVSAAGALPGTGADAGQAWPIALARTLWGLFFVGRPRFIPRARIRGVTVR